MGDRGCFRGVPTFANHLVSGPVGPALNCLVHIGTHTAARVAQDATTWLDRDMVGVVQQDQAPARSPGTIFFFSKRSGTKGGAARESATSIYDFHSCALHFL